MDVSLPACCLSASGGLIVRKEWVLDCHAKKRRLPAKRYRHVHNSTICGDLHMGQASHAALGRPLITTLCVCSISVTAFPLVVEGAVQRMSCMTRGRQTSSKE